MNVFISYSVDDRALVDRLAKELEPHATPYYWNKSQTPGDEAWPSIFNWIEAADCVIAIVTDQVVRRGESVHQEIGYARKCGKTIIPLVDSTVDPSRLGCLSGITYVMVDKGDESKAIQVITSRVAELSVAKRIQDRAALIVLALLALFVLWPE